MDLKLWGAFAFGLIIGWYVYFVNRYRKGDVQISDITTIIGTIGGGAVLALFDKSSDLFGAYGIGLACGFFLYFVTLIILVGKSEYFDADWFLDGRRKNPPADYGYSQDTRGTVAPMALNPTQFHGTNPGATQNFYLGSSTRPAAPSPLSGMMAAINSNAQLVIDTCKDAWPGKRDACNFFVIEVAKQLGITLEGIADEIVDEIKGVGWTRVADGVAARDASAAGKLVIAGIKSKDFTQPRNEGHVAVVVSGSMNPAGWAPAGYWGSTDPDVAKKGGGGSPISLCFRLEDKDKVVYACREF